MRYPAVEKSKAIEALEKIRDGEEVDEDDYLVYKGEELDLSLGFIDSLKGKLNVLKGKYPRVLSSKDENGGRFEAEACALVHESFRGCPAEVLSDPEFWRFLSVFRFRELIEWRHGSDGSPAHFNNYGIGNTKRNLIYRMFMRAELSYDGNLKDPYSLSRMGDKDLWDSHIIPVGIGSLRTIVRTLLKYLYPKKLDGECLLKTKEVRTLAKLITRLRANVFLELYGEENALTLLDALGAKAKTDVAGTNG